MLRLPSLEATGASVIGNEVATTFPEICGMMSIASATYENGRRFLSRIACAIIT